MFTSSFSKLLLSGFLVLGTVQAAQQPFGPQLPAPPPAVTSVNFFSVQQDREIGEEAIRETDKTVPVVRNAAINTYIRTIAGRLAQFSPPQSMQYPVHVVNSKSVSSVTYPGGAIYLDRGLLELAANEHEVAAILAHEIAHAAARHGTQQLSRQWLVQSPASILAGLPGNSGWKDQLKSLGISLGSHPSFLRYSSSQEIEANKIAVKILAKSTYSPFALPSILDRLNHPPTADSHVLPAYAYDHPQGAEAAQQLILEIEKQNSVRRTLRPSEEFLAFHSALTHLAPPPDVPVEAANTLTPLATMPYVHPENFYKLLYPDTWQATPFGANGAIIAPPASRVGNDIQMGVMFDLFDISERAMTLEQATERLLVSLRIRNPNLQVISGAQPLMLMSGEPALRTVMIGQSSATNAPEISWVVTRMYYQNLFYIVCVAPQKDFEKRQPAFQQILKSIELR